MPRTAIVESATGVLLVLNPPTREDGSVILPEGIAAEVITLTPEQEAQIQADADAAAAAAQVEATARNAATTERTAAATDLAAIANAIIQRMDAIKDDPTQTDQTAKVRAIVRDDFAPAIKKIVRYLKAQAS